MDVRSRPTVHVGTEAQQEAAEDGESSSEEPMQKSAKGEKDEDVTTARTPASETSDNGKISNLLDKYGSFPFELISAFLVPISKTSNGKNRGRPLDLIKIYSDRYPGDPIPHISQSVLDALASCWKRVRLQHEVRHDDVVKVYVWEAA